MANLNLKVMKETELCLGLGLPGEILETPRAATASGVVGNKRAFSATVDLKLNLVDDSSCKDQDLNLMMNNENMNASNKDTNTLLKDPAKPPPKAQVVGWPPVRSYRKNVMAQKVMNSSGLEGKSKSSDQKTTTTSSSSSLSSSSAAFVKVCMDGAPYLRKVDLKVYASYQQLSDALAKMFSSFTMGNYGAQGMIDFMNESKLMDLLNSSEYVPTYEDKDGDWMLVGDVPWEMFVESCKRLRIMKGSEAIGLAPRAMEKCKSRS